MVLVKYLGHACVLLESSWGKVIIDPFINNNPSCPVSLSDLGDVDLILVTHGHSDHLGDVVELSEKTGAKVVAIYELASWLSNEEGIESIGMNLGGTLDLNGLKITMVPALHSSGIVEEKIIYAGNPVGYIVETDDRKLYHMGDTMLFFDLKLIPKVFGKLDLIFVPIGGLYTMDIKQAKVALEWLKPKYAIPIHYNTWDVIKANPEELKVEGVKTVILNPGESFEF